mgnify:CR=1 FL=1
MLHFIGHGSFDEQQQDGVLLMEDSEGYGARVSSRDLGVILHDHGALRLVVLNACEGGRSSRTDPFAGAAQSLVQQGIPAVIAMQFPVTDEAAITFSQGFYGALADGYPVDAALSEARKTLFASGSGVEWGTPVLYLRAPDAQINWSTRASGPFLALNCAAISQNLVEATLFGHAKGAFTGASGQRAGYFEEASDGTLFLDEIGELPLDLQPKLLRVLENGEFQRIGETAARHSSARVVAATNRDLKKEVREGRFRADLYHRLSVFTVAIPPLRDLGEDRILLLEHFRAIYAAQADLPQFRLNSVALQRLLTYPFPGNVRELRNIAIRLTTKYAGKEIGIGELEAEFDPASDGTAVKSIPAPTMASRNELMTIAMNDIQSRLDFNLDATLRLWEEAYIDAAQKLARDNMSQAARLLGVNRATLYNKLRAYGLSA